MEIHDVIARLTAATGPARSLDGSIAKALGFKRVPKTKERDYYWLSPTGEEVKIPRYTSSFDAAYCLAITANPKGGVSWDGATGAARIGRGSSYIGATAPIALCIAAIHALAEAERAKKNDSPHGERDDHSDS